MEDQVSYIEKLRSLKELKSQQRVLSRCQWQLEQTCSQHTDCCDCIERCQIEVARLRQEREELLKRLHEIDSDIQKLSELSSQLCGELSLRAFSASLEDYSRTLEQVNITRHALGMHVLDHSGAYSQLTNLKQSFPLEKSKSLQAGKAGKSRKSCPQCFKLVSRNAVTCPACSAPCSKKK